MLAEQWNLYARQNAPGSSFNWVDTSESEMKLFMGIPLVMGVHKLTCLEDYWSQHPLLGAPDVINGMPIHQFKALQCCLHLNDNSTAKKQSKLAMTNSTRLDPCWNLSEGTACGTAGCTGKFQLMRPWWASRDAHL